MFLPGMNLPLIDCVHFDLHGIFLFLTEPVDIPAYDHPVFVLCWEFGMHMQTVDTNFIQCLLSLA